MLHKIIASKESVIASQQVALAAKPAPEIKTETPWWVWPVISATAIVAFGVGTYIGKKNLD